MADLPSGTVTFLFTDIEGSTRLLKQLRESYRDLLNDHEGLMREAFDQANGSVVDTQGDAFLLGSPRDPWAEGFGARRCRVPCSGDDRALLCSYGACHLRPAHAA